MKDGKKKVMFMKKLGNSGFTLIEAMIAMAIIVIMIAGGVSGFG